MRQARGGWRRWMVMVGLSWWLAGLGPATARAHPAYLSTATITVERDGAWHGQVRFDTLAFVLNDTSARIGNEPMETLLAGPREELQARIDGAKTRFVRGFRVLTDDGDGSPAESVEFPDAGRVLAWKDGMRPVLPVVLPVQVSGRVASGARTVAFRFPSVLEQIILTVERPDEEPAAEAVEAGKSSTPLPCRIVGVSSESVSGVKTGSGAPSENGRMGEPRKLPTWALSDAAGKMALAVVLLAAVGAGYGWQRQRRRRAVD